MAISNVTVVNTASKYIVKSTGIGSEDDQKMIEPSKGKYGAEKLEGGDSESLVSLIECYYLIESVGSVAGTLEIQATTPAYDGGYTKLSLTGKGKYGLRPNQLIFGNDKQFTLTTDSNVKSYLLVTEFRRN